MVTEVDLEEPVDQRLAHFPGKVILSVHIFGVGQEALLYERVMLVEGGEQYVETLTSSSLIYWKISSEYSDTIVVSYISGSSSNTSLIA